MKKVLKIIAWILFSILILGIIILWSIYIIDKENIKVDEYNFNQLNFVNNIIINDEIYNKRFRNIGDFNKIYKSNIMPIKNCYFINDFNWNEKYIFWFKLESLLYRIKYKNSFIVYPKYDLPKSKNSFWLWRGKIDDNTDYNYLDFIDHISNPCDEDYL